MNKASWPNVARLFQYIFFLRFPIFLWIAFAALGVVDACATTAVTRVLFTMRDKWQLLYVTFYVVLAGWQALTSARLVCAYGEARFNTPPPDFLALRKGELNWPTFLVAQVPGLVLLAFIYARSHTELRGNGVSTLVRFTFIASGGLFAFAFWYVLAWFYAYLHPSVKLSEMHSFLFPTRSGFLGRWLDNAARQDPGPVTVWLRAKLSETVAFLGPGFVEPTDSETILPGQYFAVLMLIGLIALHFALALITYPLPRGPLDFLYRYAVRVPYISAGFISIVLAIVLFICSTYYSSKKQASGRRLCLYASVIFLALWILIAREPDFPALATILVLLSAGLSLLAGCAFILDRYRFPALVPLIVWVLFFQTILHPDHIFFGAQSQKVHGAMLKPRMLVSERKTTHPWIVVTATGGGIHSAVWTSTVLAEIEQAFCRTNGAPDQQFHNNILLLSSASGGSIAVANWMREYAYGGKFSEASANCNWVQGDADELEAAASAPSVEAAAWGLLHYDLYGVLFPFFSYHNWEDRGWFLEQSLLLNRYRAYMGRDYIATVLADRTEAGSARWNQLPTLRDLGDLLGQEGVPAFALNATSTDSGERYVLGNYALPAISSKDSAGNLQGIELYHPALSFLSELPGCDLSLMTAARLSATFPYVSPTSRLDNASAPCVKQTEHLADGGYYDNDGVASAAEFLWLALGPQDPPDPPRVAAQDSPAKNEGAKPEIWVIQIRDSPLPQGPEPLTDTGKPSTCGPFCELLAPLGTLYASGHVADPERNQRDLAVLNTALANGANLQTIVYDYRAPSNSEGCGSDEKEGDDTLNGLIKAQEKNWTTLNWLLSSKDKCQIKLRWCKDFQKSAENMAANFSKYQGKATQLISTGAFCNDISDR